MKTILRSQDSHDIELNSLDRHSAGDDVLKEFDNLDFKHSIVLKAKNNDYSKSTFSASDQDNSHIKLIHQSKTPNSYLEIPNHHNNGSLKQDHDHNLRILNK
jgi:hypothetical protein